MADTIASLEKKREGLVGRASKLRIQWATFDPATVTSGEIQVWEAKFLDVKLRYNDIYDRTQSVCTSAEFKTYEKDLDTISQNLDVMEIGLIDLKDARAKATPHVSSAFKLGRIKLKTFSGELSEWQSFRDLFESSVHKNTTLSGTEKMVHLKSSLTGKAAQLLSSFQATDTNYKLAWDAVGKRYNREREIIYAHLRKFDEFRTMTSESSSDLTALVDTLEECVRSLKILKVPVGHWETILIYYAVKKLAGETKRQWSLAQGDTLPTKKDFVDFVEARARALAYSSPSKPTATREKKTSSHHASSSKIPVCPKCSQTHYLNKCPAFLSLSTSERQKLVTEKRRCGLCLGGHSTEECRKSWKCLICGGGHHHLLHREGTSTNSVSFFSSASEPSGLDKSGRNASDSHLILLGTLAVMTSGPDGVPQRCRVFVDPGSESHFVSEEWVQRLRLVRRKTNVSITGIGGTSTISRGEVNITLRSINNSFNMSIDALILPKVTGTMPKSLVRHDWPHLKDLQLADPTYYKPGKVDILLGAQAAAKIMMPEIITGPPGAPIAQLTAFGYMLSGPVESSTSQVSTDENRETYCSRTNGQRNITGWRYGWYALPNTKFKACQILDTSEVQ